MSRKKPILGLVLITSLLGMAGCSDSGGNSSSTPDAKPSASANSSASPSATQPAAQKKEPVSLKFTYWGSPIEKQTIEGVVKKFEAQYPHIKVDAQHIPDAEYPTKITAMMAGNIAPDVGYISATQGLKWAEEGKMVNLYDLIKRDNDPEYQADQFLAKFLWEPDKMLGFSSQSFGVFYNADLLKEANIKPPTKAGEAWDWDTFVQMAKKLTIDRNGKNATEPGFDHTKIKQYGVQFSYNSNTYMNFVYSNGGKYISDDGKTFALADKEATDAIQKLADLANVHHVAPSPTEAKTMPAQAVALQSKQVAMNINGQWVLLDLAENKMNFGIGVLPKLKKPVTQIIGGPLVVFKNTKYPEEAWLFVKYMRSPKSNPDLYVKGLWMPPSKTWYTDPKLSSQWLQGNSAHPDSYKEAIADTIVNNSMLAPVFYVKNYGSIDALVTPALDKVWTGEKTAEQALKEIAPKVQAQIQGRYDIKN